MRTFIKYSLCGTAREVFVGRTSLNKTKCNNDYGIKPHTRQTATHELKPRQHKQACVPTWAVRSRASFFSTWETQSRNLKQHYLAITQETHSASQNRTRGGETMECSVGVATASRLQSWQATSYVVFVSPFFDTLARVRPLDPSSSATIRAQCAFNCNTEPTIEFSVGLEQQISSLSF